MCVCVCVDITPTNGAAVLGLGLEQLYRKAQKKKNQLCCNSGKILRGTGNLFGGKLNFKKQNYFENRFSKYMFPGFQG